MPGDTYNLAIETSGRAGSVSLGRGDRLLATHSPSDPQKPLGITPPAWNRLDLMPAIDRLTRDHGIGPGDIVEVYLSIGPGSFTGLRIAVATAKALAWTRGVRLVAVPTAEVIAKHVPPPSVLGNPEIRQLLVCLNKKRQSVYAQLFEQGDGQWEAAGVAGVGPIAELLERAGRPLGIVGDPLPEIAPELMPGVVVLPPQQAVACSTAVWAVGRAMAKSNRFTDPLALAPLYARPPEAQVLWDKRHSAETASDNRVRIEPIAIGQTTV